MLAILTGMLVTLLIVLPEAIKNSLRYRKLKKENEKLEEELRKQKELTLFAKNTTPTPEEITRIREGAIQNSSVR